MFFNFELILSPYLELGVEYVHLPYEKSVLFDGKCSKSGFMSPETWSNNLSRGVKNCVEHDVDIISTNAIQNFRDRISKSIFFIKTSNFIHEGEELESWFQL